MIKPAHLVLVFFASKPFVRREVKKVPKDTRGWARWAAAFEEEHGSKIEAVYHGGRCRWSRLPMRGQTSVLSFERRNG